MRVPGLEVELLSESESIPKFDAPLMDLNVALLRDGLHIRVEAGATLHKPVGILVIDSAMSIAGLSQINVEIELQRNSEANFIEYHASTGTSDHYANSVVKLALAENASASYVRIQDRARTHKQTGRLAARLGHDSRFRHCGFDFGGQLIRNDLNIQLDGHGASAAFDGLYLAGRDQHIDNHTRIDHNVGPATSRQEYRGIVGGAARCVWNGKAVVHSGADGTDAEQANHNLLLSDDSEIDAKPELEIYADEVKCSHGTTIGQLDEAGIFYLRTRGLDRRAAEQLVTRAFAQTIVLKSPLPEIRDAISVLVDKRLDELSHGDDR
jgi:Fe-S cluster assembly protein SufD